MRNVRDYDPPKDYHRVATKGLATLACCSGKWLALATLACGSGKGLALAMQCSTVFYIDYLEY